MSPMEANVEEGSREDGRVKLEGALQEALIANGELRHQIAQGLDGEDSSLDSDSSGFWLDKALDDDDSNPAEVPPNRQRPEDPSMRKTLPPSCRLEG